MAPEADRDVQDPRDLIRTKLHCPGCGVEFKNAGALETHVKARHPSIRQERAPAQVKKATREKFTLKQKIRALEIFYDCASDDSILYPYQETAKKFFGVAWESRRSYIGKWLKAADRFSDAVEALRAMKHRTDKRARIGSAESGFSGGGGRTLSLLHRASASSRASSELFLAAAEIC